MGEKLSVNDCFLIIGIAELHYFEIQESGSKLHLIIQTHSETENFALTSVVAAR